jgi:hypothetical protein
MAFQIPGINSLFTIIVLAGAVIAIVLILLLLKLYQVKSAARMGRGVTTTTLPSRAHAPAPPQEPVGKPEVPLSEPTPDLPEPLTDQGDIGKNMAALAGRYGLDAFTLSSTDGLLIASTSGEGINDAANYSQMWKSAQSPSDPGVKIFGITHQGSTIIGIIRSSRELPAGTVEKIEVDAKNILSWGL